MEGAASAQCALGFFTAWRPSAIAPPRMRPTTPDNAALTTQFTTPLATGTAEACGVPGPYMLDMGISSTWRIAAGWGLGPCLTVDPDLSVDRAGIRAAYTNALQGH